MQVASFVPTQAAAHCDHDLPARTDNIKALAFCLKKNFSILPCFFTGKHTSKLRTGKNMSERCTTTKMTYNA